MLSRIQKLQQARCLQKVRQQSLSPAREVKRRHLRPDSCLLSTQALRINDEDDYEEFTLTKDEAISYLENILQIKDPCKFAQNHKYDFLCEVQRRTRMTQPYSTVSLLPDPSDLRCPTKEESKKAMFRKEGGGCIQINPFTMAVLRQMGYHAFMVCGTLPKEKFTVYHSHTGLVVTDVTKKGSMHLLESGTSHPILEPISLDFERASPEYQLQAYTIKLFRDCAGIVKLCMPATERNDIRRDSNLYHDDGKVWRGMITYRILEPQTWENCSHMSDVILKTVEMAPNLHKEIIVFGYTKDLKWTVIKGKTFLQYDQNGKETSRQFTTYQEVIENANRCFPQYSKETLRRASGCTEMVCNQTD